MNHLLITACCSAGLIMLVLGIISYRRVLRVAQPLESLIRFSPVLMAVSLAIFSMEHFFDATELAAIVPAWLPFPVFWTYAVGGALLAAAISFVARKQMRWSAPLLTILFLTFVLTIHVPNTITHWKERIFWTLIVRESLFAAGTLVLAASLWRDGATKAYSSVLGRIGRTIAGIALLYFALQQFFHPRFAPGVPLPKLTPNWVPFPVLWAVLVGAIFLVAASRLPWSRSATFAATLAGGTLVFLTVFLYLPILLFEFGKPQTLEGINYVGDTLLAAAAVLLCGFGNGGLEPGQHEAHAALLHSRGRLIKNLGEL